MLDTADLHRHEAPFSNAYHRVVVNKLCVSMQSQKDTKQYALTDAPQDIASQVLKVVVAV